MRLIDANALIAYCDKKWIPLNIDAVNAQPTIDPVKHGRWIKHKDGYYRCSECGSRGSAIKAHYCHHCGSLNYGMRGEENDERRSNKKTARAESGVS